MGRRQLFAGKFPQQGSLPCNTGSKGKPGEHFGKSLHRVLVVARGRGGGAVRIEHEQTDGEQLQDFPRKVFVRVGAPPSLRRWLR